MENDQITPIQPIITPLPPKQSQLPIILLSIISLLSLSGMVYFYLQTQSLKKELVTQLATTPTPIVSPSPTPLPTVDIKIPASWLTYTSPIPTTIQYPPDWKLDTKSISDDTGDTFDGFTLTKQGYVLTFSFPSGFGPGVCIFEDQPEFNQPLESNPVSVKCPGKYVEIVGLGGTYRRSTSPPPPLEDGSLQEWGVYKKDKNGSFVTAPPINYKVPTNFDPKIVLIMDQILATFRYVK